MTLMIKDPEADNLAHELARTTGETISQAVINAMRERLERERARQNRPEIVAETILRIGRECAALPLLDDRTADEIIGYDKIGNEFRPSSSL
jgi:antitoxin VapB